MKVSQRKIIYFGYRISFAREGEELGRAYLYIITNDLHSCPYGLLEDLFVRPSARKQGVGTKLVNKAIKQAKSNRCYKIIATSRYARARVHKLYQRFGFKDYGKEFRLDL